MVEPAVDVEPPVNVCSTEVVGVSVDVLGNVVVKLVVDVAPSVVDCSLEVLGALFDV